jgi:hypothetical protein
MQILKGKYGIKKRKITEESEKWTMKKCQKNLISCNNNETFIFVFVS